MKCIIRIDTANYDGIKKQKVSEIRRNKCPKYVGPMEKDCESLRFPILAQKRRLEKVRTFIIQNQMDEKTSPVW